MLSVPSPKVIRWLNEQNTINLFLPAPALAEILYGITILPKGKKKQLLELKFKKYVEIVFEDRILSFDAKAAHLYSEILGARKKLGRPMDVVDGQIVSIALVHGFAVVTRNQKDFKACGVEIINPFLEN